MHATDCEEAKYTWNMDVLKLNVLNKKIGFIVFMTGACFKLVG